MRTRILATSMTALMLLAACGESSTDDSADTAPELDLTTLQAEGSSGVYDAEPIDGAYVGEVDPEMFIGVVFDPDQAPDGQQIRAYVCNGDDVTHWLAGELDSSGSATLLPESILLDDEPDLRVEMTTDGDVAGEVFIDDEDGRPFTATSANGDAGIYHAEQTFDGNTARASWVVLSDGRQVGGSCEAVRCGRNPNTGEKICFCVQRK